MIIPFPSRPKARFVKISRFAESFWVKVDGEELGTIWGTVNNALLTPRLRLGDAVCFRCDEVLEEMHQ